MARCIIEVMASRSAALMERQIDLSKIANLIDKYLVILQASHTPHPNIKLKDNIAADVLGTLRHTIPHDPNSPQVRVMEIQKSVMNDAKTLERVVAHETIHLVDSYEYTPQQLSLIRLGIKRKTKLPSF